ncbi:MAG: hypothetical protein WC532_08805 [Candidatus Omnitrophota bacterium]
MKKNSQTILDYVILLLVVITALMIMGHYVRNSLSGKMREGADVFSQGEVYSNANTHITENTITNEGGSIDIDLSGLEGLNLTGLDFTWLNNWTLFDVDFGGCPFCW